jgi:hypothetical protein
LGRWRALEEKNMKSTLASRAAGLALVCGTVGMVPQVVMAQMNVVSTTPVVNAQNVSRTTPITVRFDRPIDRATFVAPDFACTGRWSGPVHGVVTFSNSDRDVTLTPDRAFLAGEPVTLLMSHRLKGADGVFLRQAGYTLTFMAGVQQTAGIFRETARFSDRSPDNAQTRIYGGLACDLNLDTWPDLTLVNEVSADLRVFLNLGDGTGQFGPMLNPPTPIPFESSPNEPGDFDGDGFVDLVTSSNQENRLAVAFGNGDGTFDTPLLLSTPGYPRGIAVMDADGDADLDIAVACRDGNTIAYFRNNGSRSFAAPALTSSGGSGAYGMVGADMNNDGIVDLVTGHFGSQTATVLRGNGNGTFTFASSRAISGRCWVVACADLNNDGNLDLATANSQSANGSVVLGNGDGTLGASANYAVSGHCVAVDLADFEGDGDVDMVLSSFGGGRWHSFLNDGTGQFTESVEFPAPANPSCCLPADFDADGDVDLVLLDEIADVVIVMSNVCPADFNQDNSVDFFDYLDFVQAFSDQDDAADFNGDNQVDFFDYLDFAEAFAAGC